MKMSRLLLIGLGAFVVGLVVFMPASLLEPAVNRLLAGRGQFVAATGTIWSGQGALTWREPVLPTPLKIDWQFDPLALLRLAVGVRLHVESPMFSGQTTVAVGWGHLHLHQVDLTADSSLLAPLNPVMAVLSPQGSIRLHTAAGERLRFDWVVPLTYMGRLEAAISDLRLPQFSSQPLGSYDLRLTLNDQQIDYVASDAGGQPNMLSVTGNGRVILTQRKQFSFTGTLAAATHAPPALGVALQSIGRPAGNGKFTLDYRDSW